MALNQEKTQPLFVWEQARGFNSKLKVFFPLCSAILFKPVEFFRIFLDTNKNNLNVRINQAIAFALITGYTKLFLDVVNLWWFKNLAKNIASGKEFSELILLPSISWISPLFILRPVIIFFITSALVVLGVKFVLGFDKPAFPAVLIVAYKSVADLFYFIPIIGSIFALSWSVALIIVGLREVYRLGFLRSILAGILMPIVMLFSTLLASGPALNRILVSVYPEMGAQVSKVNDVTAYIYTSSIVSAAQEYKKDMGFYPAHLGVLKRYLSSSISGDIENSGNPTGYAYRYDRIDDEHFRLYAKPVKAKDSGNLVFYSDEKAEIKLDGPQGVVVKDVSEIEKRIFVK